MGKKWNFYGPHGRGIWQFLFLGILVISCQFNEVAEEDLRKALTAPGSTPREALPPLPPPVASCYIEEFQQPEEQIVNSVDILFIGDTSGSMANKRLKVANALHAFVGALPTGTDYRIAFLQAHGSSNPETGELYSHNPVTPKVLDSAQQTQEEIQKDLRDTMLAARDYRNEQGEMGAYTLLKALSPEKLTKSRELGFFREDAALAIIFIADENDICAVYPDPLPSEYNLKATPFENMPGLNQGELFIRRKDCPNGIPANSLINAVKEIKKDKPFVFGAVIHTDFNYKHSNDSYGWGYASVVHDTHGVLVDISSADYSSGLASLGSLTSKKLQLISDFTLTRDNINASSIKISVDRTLVEFEFNALQNEVHLFQLGGALSEVTVEYCLNTTTGGEEDDEDSDDEEEDDDHDNDNDDDQGNDDDGGNDGGGYIGV